MTQLTYFLLGTTYGTVAGITGLDHWNTHGKPANPRYTLLWTRRSIWAATTWPIGLLYWTTLKLTQHWTQHTRDNQ